MSKSNGATVTQNIHRTQVHQLTVMQAVNQLIASGNSTEKILQTVLNFLLDPLDYKAAQIYQLSISGKDVWLYLEAGAGTKPVTQTIDIFSVEESNIINDTVRQSSPVYIADVENGPYSYFVTDNQPAAAGSEVAVPLQFGQENLGVLRVQCSNPNSFPDSDIDFLSSLANSLAGTMRNNRKIKQLEDSIQEIRTLYTLQYQDKIEQQQQRGEFTKPVGYEYDKSAIIKTESIPQLSDLEFAEQAGITTLQSNGDIKLVAPIQLHDETIGVLGLENLADNQAEWTADDINLLEEVSSQVALAIENSRLLQQTQEQTNELSILFEATRQLTETIDLKQIYQILTSHTINYLNADYCSALLLNQARTHFETIVAQARTENNKLATVTDSRSSAIDDLPSLQNMLKNPGIIIQHLDDQTLNQNTRTAMAENDRGAIQTAIRFPLIVRSKLVGILEVEHLKQQHDYSDNELQLAGATYLAGYGGH